MRPRAAIDGGQSFSSRGLEKQGGNAVVGLVRQLMGLQSEWNGEVPYIERYNRGTGGTPNHRLLLRVGEYGKAMRSGTIEERSAARIHLAEFFTAQFTTEGQMWGETLNTSHYQIWLLGVAGARYMARHYTDGAIEALTAKWFRRELFCYNLLARDGYVFSPGSRSYTSNSELRDVVYAMLRDQPAPQRLTNPSKPITGRPNDPGGAFWTNVVNSGAWILSKLIEAEDDLGGAAQGETEEPLLRDHLCCYSRGDDFLFIFPHLTKASDALFWTARINGQVIDAQYHGGQIKDMDNPYPPPKLTGAGSPVVVPGVNGSPQDCGGCE